MDAYLGRSSGNVFAEKKSAEIVVVESNEPESFEPGRTHKATKDRTLSSFKYIVDAPSGDV